MGLIICEKPRRSACDLVDGVMPVPGVNDRLALRQPAVVLHLIAGGDVAIHHERYSRVVGRNPHAVVAPRDVQVGGVREPALAGRMTDLLAGLHELPGYDALTALDVHI